MAQICLHCGAENPDDNTFCSSCGASLAGPAPVAAPGAPVFPAGASPYLAAPPPVAAPLHRMSRNAVLAIAVSAVIVIGGAGVAFAALHKGGTTPVPAPNVPINVPTFAPTAAPTQSPATAPTPQSTSQAASQGKIVTTPFASVFVPTGYTLSDQHSDYVVLTPSNGQEEAVGVQSDPLLVGSTNTALDQALLQGDQQNGDPSAAFCSSKAPSHAQLNGSAGAIIADVISICEDLTPASGPAFAAVDGYIDGVARASDGTLKAVWIEFLAPASSFQAFVNGIPPGLITQTVFTDAGPLS
jgi:zinc-ribbon domain